MNFYQVPAVHTEMDKPSSMVKHELIFAGVLNTTLTQKGIVPLPCTKDNYILVPGITRFLTNILHHILGQNGQTKLSKMAVPETAFQHKSSCDQTALKRACTDFTTAKNQYAVAKIK